VVFTSAVHRGEGAGPDPAGALRAADGAVDLRTVVLDVRARTSSRATTVVKVNAVLYSECVDADRAVIMIETSFRPPDQACPRPRCGRCRQAPHLARCRPESDKLNGRHQGNPRPADRGLGPCEGDDGRDKQVDIDTAWSAQSPASRGRGRADAARAKVINDEGEQQAAAKLVEAADILATPAGEAMQVCSCAISGTLIETRSRARRLRPIVFPFPSTS